MFKGNTPLMEGLEQETIEQPAQVYDMDKGEYVDNPALKKDNPNPNPDPDPNADPEPDPDPNADPEPEPDADPNADPEPDPDPNADPDDPKDKDEDEVLDADAFIAEVYGEKYGVKSQTELETLVESAAELQDEHEALKRENETLKAEAGKLVAMTPKQKKAVEFISQFDIDRQGEALDTFAKLISMDVDTSDAMMVLEERYIHEHPEWTRAEAQRMFSKDYNKRFTLKKEDFDSEADYNSEVADMEIMKKGEVARSRAYLKDQQTKYKPQATENKPLVSEAVTKSIEKIAPEYTAHAEKTNEITFEQDGDKYVFKLDADKKSKVNAAVKEWVKNPTSYSKDGKLLGVKTPDEMMNMVIGSMFMKDIISAITDQVKNSVNIKRVDEVGKNKPAKRKAPGSGDAKNTSNDLYSQAQNLIKKKAAAN